MKLAKMWLSLNFTKTILKSRIQPIWRKSSASELYWNLDIIPDITHEYVSLMCYWICIVWENLIPVILLIFPIFNSLFIVVCNSNIWNSQKICSCVYILICIDGNFGKKIDNIIKTLIPFKHPIQSITIPLLRET